MTTQESAINDGLPTQRPKPGGVDEQPDSRRYRTVLVDPPWNIEQSGKYGAASHYSLMSLSQIGALPVGDLVASDAHLWLWVTNATLRHGYDIAERWASRSAHR